MSWKKYRDVFLETKPDESHFVLGIDIGNLTACVSYFDAVSMQPEVVDMSGGYGKASVPTVVQYIGDTGEWVFGEYALLNKSETRECYFENLVERLGHREYLEAGGKSISVVWILAQFTKELIANLKNINPRAEVAGLVISVPSYMSEEAKNEFNQVVKTAGFSSALVRFATDRECVFSKYFYQNPVTDENVLLLDFGGRELRGGIYSVSPGEEIQIRCSSSMFESALGAHAIERRVYSLFSRFYEEKSLDKNPSNVIIDQLSAFTYQHKDLLFQKSGSKTVKLYYNFVYPPIVRTIDPDEIKEFIRPFERGLGLFIEELLEKSEEEFGMKIEVNTVICIGGGFEMPWARAVIEKRFPECNRVLYKNAKGISSEGASLIAAGALNIIKPINIKIIDEHQLSCDFGLITLFEKSERFVPIAERNSFWWQRHAPQSVLLTDPTDVPVSITICSRNEQGGILPVSDIMLDGLPVRPGGTTRLKILLEFLNRRKMKITVIDAGFGELFPKTNFVRDFEIIVG